MCSLKSFWSIFDIRSLDLHRWTLLQTRHTVTKAVDVNRSDSSDSYPYSGICLSMKVKYIHQVGTDKKTTRFMEGVNGPDLVDVLHHTDHYMGKNLNHHFNQVFLPGWSNVWCLLYLQIFFVRINPEQSKWASKAQVSRRNGKMVQQKNKSLNPHVASFIRDLIEYDWQKNWYQGRLLIHFYLEYFPLL